MQGGVSKWQRIRRQTIRVNQPLSMFTDTHLLTSDKAKLLHEAEDRPIYTDTSYNTTYDEAALRNHFKLSNVSQNQESSIGKTFDHLTIFDNKLIIGDQPITLNDSFGQVYHNDFALQTFCSSPARHTTIHRTDI